MRQKLVREPTDTEVSLFLEIDEKRINEVRCALQDVQSLDFQYDEDVSLYNSVMSFDKETNASVLDLKDQINKLSKEEKDIIEVRYYQDMTLSEESRKLGMSQVQVSRKEGKILEKLRCRL